MRPVSACEGYVDQHDELRHRYLKMPEGQVREEAPETPHKEISETQPPKVVADTPYPGDSGQCSGNARAKDPN